MRFSLSDSKFKLYPNGSEYDALKEALENKECNEIEIKNAEIEYHPKSGKLCDFNFPLKKWITTEGGLIFYMIYDAHKDNYIFKIDTGNELIHPAHRVSKFNNKWSIPDEATLKKLPKII